MQTTKFILHPLKLFCLLFIMSLSALTTTNAIAAIKLPKLVGDNMVLQRDMPLKIWGWASANEPVTIEFRSHKAITHADDKGEWSVMLPAQTAGGPFTMTITGSNSITLKNILVGDVWLASGQSNMEFPMATENGFGGALNEKEEIANANYPQIRLFTVKRNISLTPLNEIDSTGWHETTPENVRQFSAVAYFFARDLYKHNHTPIGIIHSSWGGTPAESWTSAKVIRQLGDFNDVMQREARITAAQWTAFDDYLKVRNEWYAKHGKEDRGTVDGKEVWAAANLDDSHWQVTTMPKPWPARVPKEFDGTIWLRRHIQLTAAQASKGITLHLSQWVIKDTTFVNGHQAGSMNGGGLMRNYAVSADNLRAGDNVIAMRVTGDSNSGEGFVGSYVAPEDVYVIADNQTIPLSGDWLYQPGPDLADLPEAPPVAEFRSPFPQSPTLLYNAMIAPLLPAKIKGVIWYQGEANADRPAQYRRLFPAMIRDWRARWGYDFPFLFVQLAGFGNDKPQPAEYPWAELREAQDMTLSLPATGMATAVDIGNAEDIHPKNKQEVGRRLALQARKVAYHEKILADGPRYMNMQIEGKQVRLHFSNTGTGLMLKHGNELRGFAIAGKDGKFLWARAVIDGHDVIVSNDDIAHPTAVRYDWSNTPNGNLYNKQDLPALPFRTDKPGKH